MPFTHVIKYPYSSPVQVGKPDTSQTKSQTTQKDTTNEVLKTEEALKNVESFEKIETNIAI